MNSVKTSQTQTAVSGKLPVLNTVQSLGVCWLLSIVDARTLVTTAVVSRLYCQEKILLGRNKKEMFWQSQAAPWQMGPNAATFQGLYSCMC